MCLIKKAKLKIVGKACKHYRQLYTNKTQQDVAEDLSMSFQSVSAFETGRNDSAMLLLWYYQHGMTKSFMDNFIEEYSEALDNED